jgi:WhiB family transcriptional regulator, redox-sensing transcriptional regulator
MPKTSDPTRPVGEASSRPSTRRVGVPRPRPYPAAVPGEPQLWWESGACRGADPVLFFPPDQDRARERMEREQAAIALCRSCPVRRVCLKHALAVPERFGVWGGTTEIERRNLHRRLRAGAESDS